VLAIDEVPGVPSDKVIDFENIAPHRGNLASQLLENLASEKGSIEESFSMNVVQESLPVEVVSEPAPESIVCQQEPVTDELGDPWAGLSGLKKKKAKKLERLRQRSLVDGTEE
jgi:hypothetical protein